MLDNVSGTFEYGEPVTCDNGATGIYYYDTIIIWTGGDWDNAVSITGDSSTATADILRGAGYEYKTPMFNIDDTIIYGGKTWKNLQGNIGNSEDDFTLNSDDWELIDDYTNDLYYDTNIDIIHYNYNTDNILYRKDNLNNEIDSYNIKYFQWNNIGMNNAGIHNNYIKGGQCRIINTLCQFISNTINGGSINMNNNKIFGSVLTMLILVTKL